MRRKAGTLMPLETSILVAAFEFRRRHVTEFHGYQIARHIANVADRRLLTAYGTLYRALGRLEQMQMLASHWEDPQIAANENRPARRLYSLTGQGEIIARASWKASAVPRHGRRKVAPA